MSGLPDAARGVTPGSVRSAGSPPIPEAGIHSAVTKSALPGVYRTIVADPPWRYSKSAPERRVHEGRGASAEVHYPTMTNDEIAAMPIKEQAADSAHLYLWVTNPRLFRGRFDPLGPIDIVEAWGFEYVTLLTWHKLGAPGTGWYFRGDTEHVIFAKRGDAPIPSESRVSNHFAASRAGHSSKPDRFYEIVERVSPGPYLELFARRRRYGWDVWGNEAPEEAASQAVLGLSFLEPTAVQSAAPGEPGEAA